MIENQLGLRVPWFQTNSNSATIHSQYCWCCYVSVYIDFSVCFLRLKNESVPSWPNPLPACVGAKETSQNPIVQLLEHQALGGGWIPIPAVREVLFQSNDAVHLLLRPVVHSLRVLEQFQSQKGHGLPRLTMRDAWCSKCGWIKSYHVPIVYDGGVNIHKSQPLDVKPCQLRVFMYIPSHVHISYSHTYLPICVHILTCASTHGIRIHNYTYYIRKKCNYRTCSIKKCILWLALLLLFLLLFIILFYC